MVQAIISSKVLYRFIGNVLHGFDSGDLFEIELDKLSCVFDSVPIQHKGSGCFEYSKGQLMKVKDMLSTLNDFTLNIEFHEKQIKLIID